MWPNPPETADFVTFTEEILNWKLLFLCSVSLLPIKSKRKKEDKIHKTVWIFIIVATYKRFGTLEGHNLKLPNNVIKKGLFNNFFMLKLPLFNPRKPHHHASSQIIARPTFCYVTPDIDTLCYLFFFFFFEVENKPKDTHPPMIHSAIFLSN